MDAELTDLHERLRRLEEEFERKLDTQRAAFRYQIEKGRVLFEEGIIAEHRKVKTGLTRFLRNSASGSLLLAPFIYFLIFPLLLLDLSVWL